MKLTVKLFATFRAGRFEVADLDRAAGDVRSARLVDGLAIPGETRSAILLVGGRHAPLLEQVPAAGATVSIFPLRRWRLGRERPARRSSGTAPRVTSSPGRDQLEASQALRRERRARSRAARSRRACCRCGIAGTAARCRWRSSCGSSAAALPSSGVEASAATSSRSSPRLGVGTLVARRPRRVRGAQPQPAAALLPHPARDAQGRRSARAGGRDQPRRHRGPASRAPSTRRTPPSSSPAARRWSTASTTSSPAASWRRRAASSRMPLVHGAIAGWYGQVAVQLPGDEISRPCSGPRHGGRASRRRSGTRRSRRRSSRACRWRRP